MSDFHPDERAAESYALSYARVQQARREWEKAGRPLIREYNNKMIGADPLLKFCASSSTMRPAVVSRPSP